MNANHHDYSDAILDRGLAELVGGERPPDLSERILAAAQATANPVTLAEGPATMSTAVVKQSSRLKSWAILAASIACIATVIGLLPAARRLSDHNIAAKIVDNSALDRAQERHSGARDNDSLMMTVTPHIIIEEGEEERLSVTDGKSAGGIAPSAEPMSRERIESAVKRFNEHRDAGRYSEMEQVAAELHKADPDHPVAQQVWDNAIAVRRQMLNRELSDRSEGTVVNTKSASELQQENELRLSQNLSSRARGQEKSKSSATGTTFGIRPNSESASEPTASSSADERNFDWPAEGRQSAGEVGTPARQFAPNPSLGLDSLINDAYADAGLWSNADPKTLADLRGKGQRFRIDAAPGSDVNRYLDVRVHPVTGLILPIDPQLGTGPDKSSDDFDSGFRPTLQEVNTALAKKLKRHEQLSVELGGASSAATNSPEMNKMIQKLVQLHPRIIFAKEKTIRLQERLQELPQNSTEANQINDELSKHERDIARLSKTLETTRRKINETALASTTELIILESEIERLRILQKQLGTGPGTSGDKYTRIYENPFITAKGGDAVSTFSIDVDTASYANVRQFLTSGQLPPPDAVRIEELVNYFQYDYSPPTDDTPFAANMEVAACPWNPAHRLARIAIKGKEIDRKVRPQSNLVFLIDVSGSMNERNKLPLLIDGMKLLTRELGENDKVSIVVYASSEGLALPSTRGDQQQTILTALDNLRAGGSTAGGAGINLAYQVAQENFIKGGVNRVILCTDGDFNVGVTSTADLERLAEEKAKGTKVFLTVLGFGRGNLNDAMMEAISGKGNGNYHYVDNLTEARKVLVEEMSGTLVTIAKDVKIQVEFNPVQVAGYRLIGYENRMLRTQDFNDDKKDAGEIGAGHTVTALYEIIPAGEAVGTATVDPLKYQPSSPSPQSAGERLGEGSSALPVSDELLTLKLRYKLPDADTSTKVEFPITDSRGSFADATDDFQFAAAVASFGMLLRDSQHKGNSTFDAVLETAQTAIGNDPHGYRGEFLELVRQAKELSLK